MSPIIITRCKCEPKKNIYVSIPREVYFKEDMKNHDWQLEYSKRVKEEKYKFYTYTTSTIKYFSMIGSYAPGLKSTLLLSKIYWLRKILSILDHDPDHREN